MNTAAIVLAIAVLLDLLLGDPVYRLHPVRLIGALIGALERGLRRIGLSEIAGGALLLGAVLMVVPGVYLSARWMAWCLFPSLGTVLDIYVFYSCIALRDMVKHARPIERALTQGDLEAARLLLQRIVGRGGFFPYTIQIQAQSMNAVTLLISQTFRALTFASRQFGLGGGQLGELLLPLGFQGSGDEAVLRFHGSVATLSPFGLVAGLLDLEPPLRHGTVIFGSIISSAWRAACMPAGATTSRKAALTALSMRAPPTRIHHWPLPLMMWLPGQ